MTASTNVATEAANEVAPGRVIGIAVRARPKAPMTVIAEAEVAVDAGLAGDGRRRPGRRQVTLLDQMAWQAATAEAGADLPWTVRRANLLVAGIALARLPIGVRLAIGDALLEVTGETEPCRRMDEAHGGLRAALARDGRGGVTTRVVAGGRIAVGMAVMLGDAAPSAARAALAKALARA
jgi:MOSC domain-containing protein YiiM